MVHMILKNLRNLLLPFFNEAIQYLDINFMYELLLLYPFYKVPKSGNTTPFLYINIFHFPGLILYFLQNILVNSCWSSNSETICELSNLVFISNSCHNSILFYKVLVPMTTNCIWYRSLYLPVGEVKFRIRHFKLLNWIVELTGSIHQLSY